LLNCVRRGKYLLLEPEGICIYRGNILFPAGTFRGKQKLLGETEKKRKRVCVSARIVRGMLVRYNIGVLEAPCRQQEWYSHSGRTYMCFRGKTSRLQCIMQCKREVLPRKLRYASAPVRGITVETPISYIKMWVSTIMFILFIETLMAFTVFLLYSTGELRNVN
jgi:hypothetical protein